jgi:hypothetical protein
MYRKQNVDPIVRQQMFEACGVLHDWKKFKPAIAGGCLWSWAASRPARDVDIYVKDSRLARKKASSYIPVNEETYLKKKVIKHGYWYNEEKAKKIKAIAYTSRLPMGCPLDLILTPYPGVETIHYFDYRHCMVAFSLDRASVIGARYYVAGELEINHKDAREEKVIMNKIQKSLWGRPEAESKIKNVIFELKRICYDR